MMGTICLALVCALSFLAAFLFLLQYKRAVLADHWASTVFYAAFFFAGCASLYLYWLIFQNHFDIVYVWNYSSRDLPFLYKLAAFWAGQEGSFLFWLFIHALIGCLLLWQGRITAPGLAVYSFLQAVLAIFLLGKSPFLLMTESYPDGAGMNPLLQDPWMAIHPPIVFIGYALLAVPFAISAGALLSNETRKWLPLAEKWALAAWSFLGAGIFIGGYWAYKVLGWGGYWGWDPVENSSLVPWLLAGVLVHLLRLSRIRGAVQSMAHLAAVFAFSMVLYGTFLARSGILGDFSVHSFSGTSIGLLLAAACAVILLGGLLLLLLRSDHIPKGLMYEKFMSREFCMLAGMLVFVFIAVLVFIGMSMPLLSQLAGKAAGVDTGFYVKTTLPLGIAAAVLMTCSTGIAYTGKKMYKPLFLMLAAVLGLAAALLAGIRNAGMLVLAGTSLCAVTAACFAWHKKILGAGGMLAHAGFGLGLFAIVLSGSGSQEIDAALVPNEPQLLLGHEIVYRGIVFPEGTLQKQFLFTLDGQPVQAITKLRENGEDAAREPAIAHKLYGDVYIAPSVQKQEAGKELILQHGRVEIAEDLAFQYRELDFAADPQQPESMKITLVLSVTNGDTVEDHELMMLYDSKGVHSPAENILQGSKRIRLTGVAEDQKRVRIELLPSESELAAEPLKVSLSTKPGIALLWLSCGLIVLGCLLPLRYGGH